MYGKEVSGDQGFMNNKRKEEMDIGRSVEEYRVWLWTVYFSLF